jgi:antitoxin VapB
VEVHDRLPGDRAIIEADVVGVGTMPAAQSPAGAAGALRPFDYRTADVYPTRIYIGASRVMTKARVFKSGNSQAVRLPKEFRFESKEVEIFRRGDEIVLREKPRSLAELLEKLPPWPEDFEVPPELPQQERDVSGL